MSRCIDCKHWDRDGRGISMLGMPDGMQFCSKHDPDSRAWQPSDGPAFYADSFDGVYGGVYTAPDFGCVNWEPNDPQAQRSDMVERIVKAIRQTVHDHDIGDHALYMMGDLNDANMGREAALLIATAVEKEIIAKP